MTRGKARERAPIGNGFGLSEHGQPRAGERVGVTLGRVEQQRDARVEGDVAAVLGEVREQQQRTGVEIGGDQHQRGVRRAMPAGGERRPAAAAQ